MCNPCLVCRSGRRCTRTSPAARPKQQLPTVPSSHVVLMRPARCALRVFRRRSTKPRPTLLMGGELCVLGFLRNYSHVRQLQSYWSLSCDHGSDYADELMREQQQSDGCHPLPTLGLKAYAGFLCRRRVTTTRLICHRDHVLSGSLSSNLSSF